MISTYCIDVHVAQTVAHELWFQGSARVGVLWHPLQGAPSCSAVVAVYAVSAGHRSPVYIFPPHIGENWC